MAIKLTDQQWASATKYLDPPLPDAARSEVNHAIQMALVRQETWRKSPDEVRDSLATVANAAEKLAALIDALGDWERIELSKYFNEDKMPPGAIVAELSRVFARACTAASSDVSHVGKAFLADVAIDDLGRILHRHTGKSPSRAKGVLGFLQVACEVAGISSGSVVEAIRRYQSRGGNLGQKSSKIAAEISR